jgi:citrate synthase
VVGKILSDFFGKASNIEINLFETFSCLCRWPFTGLFIVIILPEMSIQRNLNASTFAARVTASTLSDMYSAITSAVGTLRGKLHGGASERVMNMILDVDNLEEVEAYIQGMLFDGKKIMGFGHRVYLAEDPRSRHLRTVGKALCQRIDRMDVYRKCRAIQAVVHKERKIYPNVDFYAALVLNALGVPKEFFTPFFASSRIAGWTAHILEQYSESVLIRPTSKYINVYGTKFVPIEKR